MQQSQELPDEERRQELESDLEALRNAKRELEHVEAEGNHNDVAVRADQEVGAAIDAVKGDIDALPEWDTDLVKSLVLENAHRSDTKIERLDNELHFYFEVHQMGESVECRWATAVAHDSEWFFVKRNGDWDEVWTAH